MINYCISCCLKRPTKRRTTCSSCINAIHTFFPAYFPKIEKLEKQGEKNAFSDTIEWFYASGFQLLDDCSDEEYQSVLDDVAPLGVLIKKYQPQTLKEDLYFMKEFILWGLVEYDKLSKDRFENGYQFKDPFGSFIDKL